MILWYVHLDFTCFVMIVHEHCENENYNMMMTHTQGVNPRPEIGVLLLELGVGLVSRVSLVSQNLMVRVRAVLCMMV